MRIDLDHLPAAKQRELDLVMMIVFEEFENKLALANGGWKKKGRIEKIILYGSYTPHIRNLGFLRTQAERLDMRLVDVWPRETQADRAHLEKLKEAYVKARYSRHYKISEKELTWLGGRVEELGRAVDAICSKRIGALAAAAKAPQ